MPVAAPSQPKTKKTSLEPAFWQEYAVHVSVGASFLVHILYLSPFVLVLLLAYFFGTGSTENAKPPEMDAVEIAGGGGRPEGIVDGKGLGGKGPSPKRENLGSGLPGNPRTGDMNVKDIAIKDVGKKDFDKIGEAPVPIDAAGDVWDKLDREQAIGKRYMEDVATAGAAGGPGDNTKGGAPAKGTGGGVGGGKGSGAGTGDGPGQGKSKTGVVFTEQRRRELRWRIHASEDGMTHLKKLQALQVTLIVPLVNKPGYALKYDLSKPGLVPVEVRAEDDSKKVRWKNTTRSEMIGLASILRLPQVPPYTVIYLPPDMEAEMARLELAHAGRHESDIVLTEWDVRERDGTYENQPYIVRQVLRPGVK
jgi:hypothetical protein